MRSIVARSLIALACMGLVGAQLAGLHMHVDDHGYAGAPHASHSHSHSRAGGHDPHDHEHETDVNAIDLGTIASKHLILMVAAVLSIVLLLSIVRRLAPHYVPLLPPAPRRHWRPPLRAPPATPLTRLL